MATPVTDAALLAELNGSAAPTSGTPVTDPAVLAELDPISWSDVPGRALQNAPSSIGNFVSDIVQPILHPIDTATAIKNVGQGYLEKGGLISGDEHTQYADAVNQYFANRYTSTEGFKRALAEDPAGVFGDISTLLTGGEAVLGRLPGLAGKAAKAAGTAGRFVDPLNAVTAPAAGAVWGANKLLGVTTGAGGEAIAAARQAGREGGAASEALTSQMRRNAPIDEIVADARAAANQMKRDAQASYQREMAATRANPAQLQFNDIDAAVNRIDNIVNYHGRPRQELLPIRDRLVDLVNEWKGRDPAFFHTPAGFDELKKVVYEDVLGKIPFEDKAARKIAGDLYDAVKGTIVKQDPTYAKTMADYERYSTALREIERTLIGKPNAPVEPALRKLTSIMRNNVNTNFGKRIDMVSQLEAAGAPQLTNKIAGASLNAWEPRGLARAASGVELFHALGDLASGHVGSLALIPATLAAGSPRIVGEGSHALGVAQRYMDRFGYRALEGLRQTGRVPRLYVSPNRDQ
ncbi:hypothetical protein IVB46_39665 [Bradyrhizobium sp. 61]|uniref:hypothetical protein n=1 Tax=unclassified Bradyrhizobium TaxID=2631580 RepID=UPI001FF76555|nr:MULTISPECIES: hypothetical protein [unclassified Bradyrhizobium]MCK1281354.1 hypothetical protein [Bradyrhizobium sp. 61]MCK1461211.1 hypothetical protein [Bradyrhizobium sp. 2]